MSFWLLNHPADQPALIDEDGRQWTYGELQAKVASFGFAIEQACLVEAATSPNKKLGFILCENTTATVIAYLSGLQRGDAVCLLDGGLGAELLAELVRTYRPDWVVSPKKLSDVIEAAFAGERTGAPDSVMIGDSHLYALRFAENGPLNADPPIHPDCALLLTTSGTTGSPKLVRLGLNQLAANAGSIAEYLQLSAVERPITSLPLHYSYGLSVLNSHLLVGATVILTDHSVMSKPFWQMFKTHRASSLAGVPYTYQMLDRLRMLQGDLPSLRTLTQAGGRLDPGLVSNIAGIAEQRGWRFFVMYGQTEATARMSYLPAEVVRQHPDSIGKAVPGGRFELATDGELMYCGPNVMLGYAYCRADLARGDELDGRLATGDLARVDEHGFYYITGRKNRFLKLFGLRIGLDEVERRLQERYSVICGCVGDDQRLVIFVEKRLREADAGEMTGDVVDPADVKQYVSQMYRIHHSAIEVQTVTELPRNSNGKLNYKLMNEWVST